MSGLAMLPVPGFLVLAARGTLPRRVRAGAAPMRDVHGQRHDHVQELGWHRRAVASYKAVQAWPDPSDANRLIQSHSTTG